MLYFHVINPYERIYAEELDAAAFVAIATMQQVKMIAKIITKTIANT